MYLILLMSSGLPYFGRAVSTWLIMLVHRKRRRGDRQVKNADMSDTRTTYMTASDRTAGFQKNEYWASCKTSCTAGIDPADPPEYATPWTCKALACTTSMTCKLFDCCNILYSSSRKCLFAIIRQCSFDFWEFTHSRISVRSVKFVAFYGIFFGSYSLVTFVCIANYA